MERLKLEKVYVNIRKEDKPNFFFLVHQHGRRLVVLGHQYGRCYHAKTKINQVLIIIMVIIITIIFT